MAECLKETNHKSVNSTTLSEYEKLREERIQRNKQKMKSLGLLNKGLNKSMSKTNAFVSTTNNKRKLDRNDQEQPLRRSKRIAITFKDTKYTLASSQKEEKTPKNLMLIQDVDMDNQSIYYSNHSKLPVSLKKNIKKKNNMIYKGIPHIEIKNKGIGKRLSSSKICVEWKTISKWIGKQILPLGKFTIMSGACSGYSPTFSKMSGVQPWKNGAMLFVNIDDQACYNNIFEFNEETDRICFNWFAQNRHKEDSKFIQQLLQSNQGDQDLFLKNSVKKFNHNINNPKSKFPVTLFCRLLNGPYVYCGLLGYLGHLTTKPLQFKWQLLERFELQWNTSDFFKGNRDMF